MIFLRKYHLYLLLLIALILNLGFYLSRGVGLMADSHRYLGYAQQIWAGDFYHPHNVWYIAYGVFLSLLATGAPLWLPILVQITLSVLALGSLYWASFRLFQSKKSALITCLFFIVFYKLSYWNTWILTESLFISFHCFFLYCLVRFHRSKSPKWLILTLSTLMVLFWLRPLGIALVAGFLIYLYHQYLSHRLTGFQKTALCGSALALGLLLINTMLETYELANNYATGEVIFGVSKIANYPSVESLLLTPPKGLTIPSDAHGVVFQTTQFILQEPVYFLKLAVLKVGYFISHYRPYYSWIHNLYHVGLLWVAYLGFIVSIKNQPMPIKSLTISYIGFTLLIISLTTVDWDGRFLMGLLPIVFLFGGDGLRAIVVSPDSATPRHQ